MALPAVKGADISACGLYRWLLWREWGHGPTVTFVMLNPSTADAYLDDPTIRRCVSFARRDGFGRVEVVNLFAFRATKPLDLISAKDPCGGEAGDSAILESLKRCSVVVCAWGAHPFADRRANWFAKTFENYSLKCLGVTKNGSPKHPLYLAADAQLKDWPASK